MGVSGFRSFLRFVLPGVLITSSFAGAAASADVVHAAADAVPRPEVAVGNRNLLIIADSVGLSAKETLPGAFPGRQVTVVGFPGVFVEQLETVVRSQPQSVFGDVAVVAAGYNYPYFDPPRFDRSVDSMLDTLRSRGVKRVVWVTLREIKPEYVSASALKGIAPYSFYFAEVNDHLRDAVARHPDLTLADWSAISDQTGLTYDAIHLSAAGQALYGSMIADVVNNASTELALGSTTAVTVAGINGVPADAKAVAVNLTVTTPRREGYLTAWPCGTPMPATSNLNYRSDQTVAVSAVVNVGTGGQICLFNSAETEAVVDVQGFFSATSSYQTTPPARLADTRTPDGGIHAAGAILAVRVAGAGGVPADAAAVAVNLTVTDNEAAGYATAFPCDQPPPNPIALVNYIPHTATPNFSIVKPAADGTICINTSSPANLIVDAFGYFPKGSSVSVTSPLRLADTRTSVPLPANTELVVPVVGGPGQPATAAASVLNITAAAPAGVGYVVAYPCGTTSPSSTLNVVPARNTSNGAIVAPGANGAVCVKSNTATHVLVDVTAWLLDGYTGLTPWRAYDSRVAR